MSPDETDIDRRRVLKGIGIAAATSVGMAAPAAASDWQDGDCAWTDVETEVYEYGCLPAGQIDTAPRGASGEVVEVCIHSGFVHLDFEFGLAEDGWVDPADLARC